MTVHMRSPGPKPKLGSRWSDYLQIHAYRPAFRFQVNGGVRVCPRASVTFFYTPNNAASTSTVSGSPWHLGPASDQNVSNSWVSSVALPVYMPTTYSWNRSHQCVSWRQARHIGPTHFVPGVNPTVYLYRVKGGY